MDWKVGDRFVIKNGMDDKLRAISIYPDMPGNPHSGVVYRVYEIGIRGEILFHTPGEDPDSGLWYVYKSMIEIACVFGE